MSDRTEAIEKALKDGVKQGQAEVGVPVPPVVTREDREAAATQLVAAWYVRFWRYLFGGGKA